MTASDRNEYLNSQQLIDEIKYELHIRGGRVNTIDLAQELNVDLNQLNLNISQIVTRNEVQSVAESLIAHYYIEEIAREINIKLQIEGKILVGDLSLQFDLPAEFLQHSVLEKYLDTIISGKKDSSDSTIYYTQEYIRRTKARLRGALMGLLKPVSVGNILEHLNLTKELFFNLFDQLNDTGEIDKSQNIWWTYYLPPCYIKARNDWLISSYKLNHYLEYFSLTYSDIPNEKEYVKKMLHNEDMVFLEGCVMDVQLKHKLENALQECIDSKSYLKVESFLNFDLYDKDIETFLVPLLENYTSSTILFDKTVFSCGFLDTLKQICLPTVQKKAESVVRSGNQEYLEKKLAKSMEQYTPVDQKAESYEEQKRKTSSGRHLRPKQDVQDSDSFGAQCSEKTSSLEIISIQDVENIIKEYLENEGLNDFVTRIAEYIQGDLNQTALAIAKDLSAKLFEDL